MATTFGDGAVSFTVLFLFMIVNSFATSEIFFLSTPGDTTARAGQTATLYCSVNRPSDSRFLWIKDDMIISQGYNFVGLPEPHRFSIIGHDTSYNLRITNIQLYDAGSYKCVVTSGTAGILSDPADLEVYAAPTSDLPECSTDSSLSVTPGEVAQLTCTVAGGRPSPDISMYRNYQAVAHSDESEESVTYTWTVTEDDHGTIFRCVGRHDLWAESRNCQLGPFNVVSEPIDVVLVPLSEIVEVGGSTSFVCHQSVPVRSTFSWLVDGIPVDLIDTPVTVQSGDISSILRIDTVRRTLDGSIVSCVVDTATDTFRRETTLILSMVPTRTSSAPTIRPDKTEKDEVMEATTKSDENGIKDVTENRGQDVTEKDESTRANTEVIIPANESDSDIFVTAILPALGILLIIVLALFVVILSRLIQDVRKKSNESQVMMISENISADQNDYYFKSKFVPVQKTWFGPVHSDTMTGISNSFPLAEGPRMLVEIIDSDGESQSCTEA